MSAAVEPIHDEPAEEAADRFSVNDLASAEWAVRRIGKLRADLAEAEAYAASTAAWILREREREANAERWLVEQVEGWHRQVLEEDSHRKTIRLPSGELKARRTPDTVSIADPDEFCAAYAETELVRVRMSPDLTAVKREVLKRGASFEGVEVVPGDVRFSIVCGDSSPVEEGPF